MAGAACSEICTTTVHPIKKKNHNMKAPKKTVLRNKWKAPQITECKSKHGQGYQMKVVARF